MKRALVTLAVGCTSPESFLEPVPGREDLAVQVMRAEIRNGLSNELVIDAPAGLQSVLMEVRGDRGLYFLTKFETPAGDLIEGAQYTTRFAREVPGLVDWLYPNSPALALAPGEHRVLLRGETPDGNALSEDVEIRFYAKQQSGIDTCGLHVDFLVDHGALGGATDFEPALDRAVEWVNDLYSLQGVRILDYSITEIALPDTRFDIDETETVMGQIDDVLRQARGAGTARSDSIHVVVVHAIGGSDPAGYAMGLPGPFDADRPNAAVLVATDAYTDVRGSLDVAGLASTIAHEVGHYLGLYHTSEANRAQHDPIADTPECTGATCSPEFATNIMSAGGGASRTSLTAGQAFVLKQHPLCKPQTFDVGPTTCTLGCAPPQTCSIAGGVEQCLPACDPDAPACAAGSQCRPDDLGTFVCL
jgi:hypothetical protein